MLLSLSQKMKAVKKRDIDERSAVDVVVCLNFDRNGTES